MHVDSSVDGFQPLSSSFQDEYFDEIDSDRAALYNQEGLFRN